MSQTRPMNGMPCDMVSKRWRADYFKELTFRPRKPCRPSRSVEVRTGQFRYRDCDAENKEECKCEHDYGCFVSGVDDGRSKLFFPLYTQSPPTASPTDDTSKACCGYHRGGVRSQPTRRICYLVSLDNFELRWLADQLRSPVFKCG